MNKIGLKKIINSEIKSLLKEDEMMGEMDLRTVVTNAIIELEKIIKQKTGIQVKFSQENSRSYDFVSQDLVSQSGVTGKSLFKSLIIKLANQDNNIQDTFENPDSMLGFSANFRYEHPGGGSNGHNLFRNSYIYLTPSTGEWIIH